MKGTGLSGASTFLLFLRAPAGISSESSSHSILHHPRPSRLPFSSRGRRRFRSIPNSRSDDPKQVLSHVREICRAGGVFSNVGEALCCFGKMIQMNPLPSSRDFSLLLGALVRMKHYSTAIRLIEQLPSLGIEDDVALLTIWTNCFCRLKLVDLEYWSLGFPISVVTFNTQIDGLLIMGKTDQALRFLDDMGRKGPEPSQTTNSIIAKGLCRAGDTRLAIELLRDWEERSCSIDSYWEERSCSIDSFTYGIIIDSLCKKGFITEALRLHGRMSRRGIKPNVVTYTSLVHVLCNVGQLDDALELLKEMTSSGIHLDIYTYSSLVHCLCHLGQWKDATVLLEKMMKAGIEPTVVTYNSIIQGMCYSGQLKEARRLQSPMEGMLEEAAAIVDWMIQLGKMPDIFIYSTLMNGYCLQNRMNDAMEVLNLMINGYCKVKRIDKSKVLFQEMLQRGLNPNVITYTLLQIDKAMTLLQKMEDSKIVPNIVTYTILIHGMWNAGKLDDAKSVVMHELCKGGCTEEACQLLKEMEGNGCFPDGVAYNAIIQGLLRNNEDTRAAQLLGEMVERGFSADIATMELWVKYLLTNGAPSFSSELIGIFGKTSADGGTRTPLTGHSKCQTT
ncbi:hypothetical protein BT93_A0427 [Corymbia citriodora subsp. variegata]|nr:hypothetical protein BT93_A0427 [Corymbia citriodora subsp. variegata]